MASNIEPSFEIEEKNNEFEYSIPKILVAVVLFLFLCQTAYIFYKNYKQKKTVIYLLDKQKSNEKNISFLTEKYNLAEDDNKRLEKKLYNEQEAFKKYKDSTRKRRRWR